MTSLRRALVAATLVLVAPVLGACGGSDADDPGGSAAGSPSAVSPATATASDTVAPDAAEEADGVVLRADGFRVRLPSAASRRTEKVPTAAGPLTVDLYTASDGDDGQYLVAITEAPRGGISLDGAVRGAATNVQGTVRSTRKVSYAGHEGRDSVVTTRAEGRDVTVFARFLLVRNKLFQLQYVVLEKDLAEPPAGYAEVLRSVSFD